MRLQNICDGAISLLTINAPTRLADLVSEIARSMQAGEFPKDKDMLTILGPDACFEGMTEGDFVALQKLERALEIAKHGNTKSVFVNVGHKQQMAINLYVSIWELEEGPAPEFHFCSTLAAAEDALGVGNLLHQPLVLAALLEARWDGNNVVYL